MALAASMLARQGRSHDHEGIADALDIDLWQPLLHAPGRAHPDPLSTALMSAILLGPAVETLPIRVLLPAAVPLLEQYARGGLLFALANRDPAVTDVTFQADDSKLDTGGALGMLDSLEPWRQTWRPADRAFRRALRDSLVPSGDEPGGLRLRAPMSVVGPNFVSFLNPHRVSSAGLSQELTETIAVPWLEHMLEGAADASLLVDVAAILDEALGNINEHAFPVGHENARASFVQLFVTGTRTHGQARTVQIIVFDNGVGIPASLRPKLRDIAEFDDDKEILEFSVSHERGDQPYGRARARGLPELKDIAERTGGRLTIATKASENGCVILTCGQEMKVGDLSPAPVAGTIVLANIPVFTATAPSSTDGGRESLWDSLEFESDG